MFSGDLKSNKNLTKILENRSLVGIGQLLGASGLQEASQKSTEDLAKIFQTMQNKCTEIDPKTTKNLAKILKIEVWRGSWAALGRFRATGGLPDASKTLLKLLRGSSGADSDRFYRVLGAS